MSKPDLTPKQQQMFWQRKSEIEIMGTFDISSLVGQEIQRYNVRKGAEYAPRLTDVGQGLLKRLAREAL
jgi:hypothetical protein